MNTVNLPLLLRRGTVLLAVLLILPILPAAAQGPATLTGTVVDSRDGAPLIGANVVIRSASSGDVVTGVTTDPDGNFQVGQLQPGTYTLEVRFIGYQERLIPVTLEAGSGRDLDIELELQTESLETVVVAASRSSEKILDAPASISVLQPERIRRSINTSSVEALQSVPAVDMAQTGVDRREVALRGFNEAFASGIHVLTDYREASTPALGVNTYSVMPSMPIDLSRVEVVRGPGSALYGPGVDSGVIHFFTKGPFQDPGTSVSVAGGTRAFFNGQIRQAGVLGDVVGYKVTAQYSRADEWDLNPQNPQDATEISRYRVYQDPNDPDLAGRNFVTGDFDGDGQTEAQLRREDLYEKYNVNGMLRYRLGSETDVTLNGGYSALKSAFQSGIGTLQTDGFGNSYAQIRLESGDFFAQGYLNQNHNSDGTYVYGSGRQTIDKGLQWNGQLQYRFGIGALNTEVVTGADMDLTRPRTEGTVLGRNEGQDAINEYGAYAQTSTELTDFLTLTLAGRADYNNVVDTLQFSPRAALVTNISSNHSLRASYNRAFSSPGVNSLFLDVPAQRVPLGRSQQLVFQGLGAADGFTFDQFRQNGQVTFSLPVPNFFGSTQYAVDALPILPMYGAVAQEALQTTNTGPQFTSGVAAQLSNQGLSQSQIATLAQLFGYMADDSGSNPNIVRFFNPANPSNRTDGTQLGVPDDSDDGFRAVSGPIDVAPLKQTTTQTFEAGYKGTIADRVRITVDGYYEHKEDFVGPQRVESPLAYIQEQALASDVGGRLGQIFGSTSDPTVQGLLSTLQSSGIPPSQVAELMAGVVGSGLNHTPTAVVQPDQQLLPNGGTAEQVGALLTYRNFGEVDYWGVDASIEVDLTETATVFGNVSYVSDDFFSNEELDETDTSLSLALNAPSLKVKGGFDYGLPAGFSIGATAQYAEGFPVRSGVYVGDVETYTLLDVRAAYNIPAIPGLSLSFTGKNVLDNVHREFVGAPPLGRMIMGRLTYELP